MATVGERENEAPAERVSLTSLILNVLRDLLHQS